MTTIIAFDPGKITGVATGYFDKEHALEIHWAGHMTGQEVATMTPRFCNVADIVVIEEFKLKDNDFRADLSGVRVEGMLEVLFRGKELVYRPITKKAQVPDDILKAHGLWRTGKDVDWTDGRDANDAIIHMLGYVAFDLKHRPTLKRYFKPNYGKVELR